MSNSKFEGLTPRSIATVGTDDDWRAHGFSYGDVIRVYDTLHIREGETLAACLRRMVNDEQAELRPMHMPR